MSKVAVSFRSLKEIETHHLLIRCDCCIFLNLPQSRIAIPENKTSLIKRQRS